MSEDPKLEKMESRGAYTANVVDLAGVRLTRGVRPRGLPPLCEHKKLIFDQSARHIYCEDCDKVVDAFDAFAMLTRNFEEMIIDLKSRQGKADDGVTATLNRRVSKKIDKMWGGNMGPCCPHCRRGILPEDFERGISSVSREYEMALRKRDGTKPESAFVFEPKP